MQAGLTGWTESTEEHDLPEGTLAFSQNQRNEVRDLHELAGALTAAPGAKHQTYITAGVMTRDNGEANLMPELNYALSCGGGQAGQGYPCVLTASFSAGAGKSAGGVGYSEEVAPTLKGSAGGNCMPSVLCLHDQGGQRMNVSEDLTGTLLASANGHQPMVYEHHGMDARVRESGAVCPTVTRNFGTGGGNTPLVQEREAVYCIVGNIVDRKPENGGNGCGYQENLAYTLTAMDRHSVTQPYQELVGTLCCGDDKGSGCQYVSQDKCVVENKQLIRRLTPLECERLQGFPDGWTDIPSGSDSARYRALGNSVAVPCVEFLMKSLLAVDAENV